MDKGIVKCIYTPREGLNNSVVTAIACADVNNDGLREIVAGTAGGELMIFHVWGTTYMKQWRFKLPGPVTKMAIVDVNGDGVKELLVQIGDCLMLYCWQDYRYAEIARYCLAQCPIDWVCGDFDQDGCAEVIVTFPQELALYRLGIRNYQEIGRQELPGPVVRMAVGDTDGDGLTEFVFAYADAEGIVLNISKWNGRSFCTQWESGNRTIKPLILLPSNNPQGLFYGGIEDYSRFGLLQWNGDSYQCVWQSMIFAQMLWSGTNGTFWEREQGIMLCSVTGELYCNRFEHSAESRWYCYRLGIDVCKVLLGNCLGNGCREAIILTNAGAIAVFYPIENK